MGIQGLLPLLKSVSNPGHIKDWKGKTIAVDTYVWLHKAAFACAQDIVLGKKTFVYVNYVLHRVRMFKHHGVTPLLVFDGGPLPSKRGTEMERKKRRDDAKEKAMSLLKQGKEKEAREYFVKAVDVSPEMVWQVIKALKHENIEYIVAPYEADPQLRFLELHGFVDAILTEDSDLLVFGTENVLLKFEGDGAVVHIAQCDLARTKDVNLAGWGVEDLRCAAILSGCDYLPGVKGVGLKKAVGALRKYKNVEKVVQFLRLTGQHPIPTSYLQQFKDAELTFRHQVVFDPVTQACVPLTPLPND
ncbi:PIN domain-like protein, partial [Meredithblackwellia eburnea MCA 4105]